MTINPNFSVTSYADVTPGDALSSQIYRLGVNEAVTVPSAADLTYTRSITTSNGVAVVLEPDTNVLDGEGTPPQNPDGETVAMATLYTLVLKNTDDTLSATFVCANMDSGNTAGTIQPGGIATVIFPAGISLGATSTISITGVSGTPVVDIGLIGAE